MVTDGCTNCSREKISFTKRGSCSWQTNRRRCVSSIFSSSFTFSHLFFSFLCLQVFGFLSFFLSFLFLLSSSTFKPSISLVKLEFHLVFTYALLVPMSAHIGIGHTLITDKSLAFAFRVRIVKITNVYQFFWRGMKLSFFFSLLKISKKTRHTQRCVGIRSSHVANNSRFSTDTIHRRDILSSNSVTLVNKHA